MLGVKYMRNGNVHGLVKVSTLQWWHTSSHDFIHQKQVACYDRTKKKKTNYSIQMLYTVTIKQKEHINVRGWSEKFLASTTDGNTVSKIFSPKLVHLS